jgi:hypothetical protein
MGYIPPKPPPRGNVALRPDAEPVTVNGVVNMGLDITVYLPSLEEQRAGWYDAKARELVRQFPQVYLYMPTPAEEAQQVANLYMAGLLDPEQTAQLLAESLGIPKRRRVRRSLPLYRYHYYFAAGGICAGPRPYVEED